MPVKFFKLVHPAIQGGEYFFSVGDDEEPYEATMRFIRAAREVHPEIRDLTLEHLPDMTPEQFSAIPATNDLITTALITAEKT